MQTARFSRTTAADERAARLKEQAARADVYRFEPCLWDAGVREVEKGQLVVKIQPYGCPKNGAMGHCFVADLDGGFLRLVALGSLKLVERRKLRQIR